MKYLGVNLTCKFVHGKNYKMLMKEIKYYLNIYIERHVFLMDCET